MRSWRGLLNDPSSLGYQKIAGFHTQIGDAFLDGAQLIDARIEFRKRQAGDRILGVKAPKNGPKTTAVGATTLPDHLIGLRIRYFLGNPVHTGLALQGISQVHWREISLLKCDPGSERPGIKGVQRLNYFFHVAQLKSPSGW
jgi:hypothetical protein